MKASPARTGTKPRKSSVSCQDICSDGQQPKLCKLQVQEKHGNGVLYQKYDKKTTDDPGEAAKHALQEGGRELRRKRRVHHKPILHLATVKVLKVRVRSAH